MNRPMQKLRVPSGAAALVRKLHPQLKRKVRAAIDQIVADPRSGKPLKDELSGLWSFRIGQFRLIYRIDRRWIDVVAFGPRSRIYEDTYRLVTKATDTDSVAEPRARYTNAKRVACRRRV